MISPENGDREHDWNSAESDSSAVEPAASAPPAAETAGPPEQQWSSPDGSSGDDGPDSGARHTVAGDFFGGRDEAARAQAAPAAPAARAQPHNPPAGGDDPTTWLSEAEVADLRRKAAAAMESRRSDAARLSQDAGQPSADAPAAGAQRLPSADDTGPQQRVYWPGHAQAAGSRANHAAPPANYPPPQTRQAPAGWPQQPYAPAAGYPPPYARPADQGFEDAGLAQAFRQERHTTVTKPEPQRGWRKAVLASTLGVVNPGESKIEREDRERRERVCANVSPVFIFAVLSGKGGAAKTTTTAGVGSMFARCRGGGDVVVVDANPVEGNLASRVNPAAHHTFVDVLRARTIQSRSEIRKYTEGSPTSQLDVLAASEAIVNPATFDPDSLTKTIQTLASVYSVIGIDCGTDFHTPLIRRVLDLVTTVVVVTGVQFDSGRVAMRVHDWLVKTGRAELVQRSFLVMSEQTPATQAKVRADIEETVGPTVWKDPIYVPYDPHLYEASVIDLGQLRRRTSRAYLSAAAKLSDWYGAPPVPLLPPAPLGPDQAGGRR